MKLKRRPPLRQHHHAAFGEWLVLDQGRVTVWVEYTGRKVKATFDPPLTSFTPLGQTYIREIVKKQFEGKYLMAQALAAQDREQRRKANG